MKRLFASKRPLGPVLNIGSIFGGSTEIPEPDSSQRAIFFFTPTERTPSQKEVNEVLDQVQDITGARPVGDVMEGGVMFNTTPDSGRGASELPHPVLDVTEGVLDNVVGKKEKSTLMANSPGDMTLQGCLNPIDDTIPDLAHEKVETDVELVANTEVDSQQVEQRHYLNTKVVKFHHNVLDVMELASRRAAAENMNNNTVHSALIRSSTLR